MLEKYFLYLKHSNVKRTLCVGIDLDDNAGNYVDQRFTIERLFLFD